jgi:hypothetical protein
VKNSEVRAHVLKEFYDQEMRNEYRGIDSEFGKHLGVPRRQVEVALKYLVDMGLVKGTYVGGTDLPVTMGITALGLDVVDEPQKFSDQYEITQQVIQVTGSVYGQIAQAQQQSQVTQVQYNFQDLERLIEGHTELAASERQDLKDRLIEIEQELRKDSFSQSKVRRLLESMKKYEWLFPLVVEAIVRLMKGAFMPT